MEHKMMQVFATLVVFLALSFQPVLSQVVITKTGCGSSKLCAQIPDSCDPADNTTMCLFGSAKPTAYSPPNGLNLAFELSGNSSGYIAVGLTNSPTSLKFLLFVCGQNSSNNGSFFSTSTVYFNGTVNNTLAKSMTDVKSTINANSTKCTFNVAGLNATTDAGLRASDSTYILVVGSGELDGKGGLGALSQIKLSAATDISSFLNSTNTTAPGGASSLFHSNAVLPLVSFLTLSILTFA